jgi:site-specific recombinase XerD
VWLGYRAAQSGTGAWIVIASDGRSGYWTKAFAHADDRQKADGQAVLSYEQATHRARALARGDANAAADRPVTISEAVDAYEADLKGRGRRPYNAEWVRKHLPPHLAAQPLSTVTSKQLRHWRDALIRADFTPASVNKICKSAMASFVLAARLDPRIHANSPAWKIGFELLPNSVVSRDAVLSDAEVLSVVAAAYNVGEPFGLFVQAHAEIGSRSSQLTRCTVADLLSDKLLVPASRKGRNGGRGGHVGVPLTPALATRLREAARGRALDAPLFTREDGERWQEGDQRRPFAKAADMAGLPEGSTIYALRHSSIARLLLRGLPIRLVAELHDTSAVITEQHYGRFIARHGDDLVRAALLDTSPAKHGRLTAQRGPSHSPPGAPSNASRTSAAE